MWNEHCGITRLVIEIWKESYRDYGLENLCIVIQMDLRALLNFGTLVFKF